MEWVWATKDFQYDDEAVGYVKRGQIFELGGHRNDEPLLKHRLLALLDPQPKGEEPLEKFPRCGTCGNFFVEGWMRDRCGEHHEMTSVELKEERRERAHQRLDDLGLLPVGA